MANGLKILVNGKGEISLSSNNYVAQGGEGVVYRKSNMAYKIYHDPNKMISETKINELRNVAFDNVLGPIDIIRDVTNRNPIGFTMKYVKDTEFLCKLFNKSFKIANNISPIDITNIVKQMQDTLDLIHKQQIIVADYNEMNFLVDKSYTTPYYIDVDSWQTPSYPATAIMESVIDHSVPRGKFTDMTDWFSWGIVTFQLYTGIHPYKGRHPDYKPNEMTKRMIDGISVFDSNVKLPRTVSDFNIIPKSHLEWYKRIFINGDRMPPPPPTDSSTVIFGYTKLVDDNTSFIISIIAEYDKPIKTIKSFGGVTYIVTDDGVYRRNKIIRSFTKPQPYLYMNEIVGEQPAISIKHGGVCDTYDINRTKLGSLSTEQLMECNGILYTMQDGVVSENIVSRRFNKLLYTTRICCEVTQSSSKLFDGVIIQDIYGKINVNIPFNIGSCVAIDIKELNGSVILNAKRIGRYMIVVSVNNGIYTRHTIKFDSVFTSYDYFNETINELEDIQFVVLNGMCISSRNTASIELFTKPGIIKSIENTPIDSSNILITSVGKIIFANDNKLYTITMK